MISYVEIKDLYGMYDYTMHFTDENIVSIITGPNGFGKTTILRVVHNLCDCNFWYFYNLRFSLINIRFQEANGHESSFILEHVPILSDDEISDSDSAPATVLRIRYKKMTPSEKDIEEFQITKQDYEIKVKEINRRLRRSYYYDTQLDDDSLLSLYHDLREDTFLQKNARNIILFFENKHCCFIKEQRIISFNKEQTYERVPSFVNRYSIDEISENIRLLYNKSQMEYAQKSHSIDGTFISRLLSQDVERILEQQEYAVRIVRLKEKTDQLNRFSLLKDKVEFVEEYSDKYKDVLSLHLEDMEKKLSSFDAFLEKLELFSALIYRNVLSNKDMILDYRGITIMMKNGAIVPLSKLSSGEQNLIILYYRLVFESNSRTILLIDEPENSLHMAWLNNMLSDYIKIAEATHCQILIATHSPAFINGRWELTFDLFENNQRTTIQ